MTANNVLNQFGISETNFDNEVFYNTYIHNNINVFVYFYDLDENKLEIASCDDRLLDNGELIVTVTIEEFIKNYMN